MAAPAERPNRAGYPSPSTRRGAQVDVNHLVPSLTRKYEPVPAASESPRIQTPAVKQPQPAA